MVQRLQTLGSVVSLSHTTEFKCLDAVRQTDVVALSLERSFDLDDAGAVPYAKRGGGLPGTSWRQRGPVLTAPSLRWKS